MAEYRLSTIEVTRTCFGGINKESLSAPYRSPLGQSYCISVHTKDDSSSSHLSSLVACVAPVFDITTGDQPPVVSLRQIDPGVIDCHTRTIIDTPDGCEFAALSYVWGATRGRESVSTTECLPQDMPQTISDAMLVVRKLDLRYLWVDKYCIDQHNESELASQVSVMDLVYDRAVLTIVAACGKDASFGLPGVGSRRRTEQPTLHLDDREGLFSRRRLIFTEEQVYFECNNSCYQETLALDFHLLFDDTGWMNTWSTLFRQGLANTRYDLGEIIEDYSQRKLTRPCDIINALAGVLRAFSHMPSPVRHYWGIPMDYYPRGGGRWRVNKAPIPQTSSWKSFSGYFDAVFARALCWESETQSFRREKFPSWSWTGWMTPLKARYAWGTGYQVHDSGVKISIRKGDGTFDRLNEALIEKLNVPIPSAIGYMQTLRVEAWAVDLQLRYFEKGLDFVRHYSGSPPSKYVAIVSHLAGTQLSPHRLDSIYWRVTFSARVNEDDELFQRTHECIMLHQDFGLITRRNEAVWERIGMVDFRYGFFDAGKRVSGGKLWEFLPRHRLTIELA
ncbi:hypothetical protein DL768_007690 [Monosporascus sp. mg162]|nr:hypothetical protein DL768_007690 [Monosporascus sp. mg162]